MKATNADAGMCVLLDEPSGSLDIAASEGFSGGDVIELQNRLPRESLYRAVITNKKSSILAGDVHFGEEHSTSNALTEMRSAIMVPLQSDDGVRGVVALYSRRTAKFKSEDLDVADIGTKQIASILRQAEYYASERKTSDALAFLYRLSHVLSQYLTPKEIAENAFPIIQEEIPCKRMWLGILNDQGTVIAGQAAIGPGMRGSIARIQIELDLPHSFLDEALKTRQPVIMRGGDAGECSGLTRVMQRLQTGTLCLIPLVALSQIVGLLVMEPVVSSPTYAQRKVPIFSSLGNELGSLILARRFESRIADAEKMRMASLFANGVAHNFNNLLQAIMGQASLIELQAGKHSPYTKAAQVINDSATKGASLVQQLKSFSSNASFQKKNFSAIQLIKNSEGLYQSIVGDDIELELHITGESRDLYGDEGQIQRAITNILVNAKEAIHNNKKSNDKGHVEIAVKTVRLASAEVHPELAPGLYLSIRITDNGPGIDVEKVNRIFEPFFTTKSVDFATGVGLSGSGLGLSSAYSVVKQHEGIITVQSEVDRGAIFTMYLPLTRDHAAIRSVTQTANGNRQSASSFRDDIGVFFIGVDEMTSTAIADGLKTDQVYCEQVSAMDTIHERVRVFGNKPVVFVFDAESQESALLGYIRSIKNSNPSAKFIISCLDSQRWSAMTAMIGDISDLEVIEKTLGVWSLQSTIKRLLGVKRPPPKIEAIPL